MAIVETQGYRLADDYSRMALDIRIVDNRLKFNDDVTFVVDTGASCVVLPANALYLDSKQAKMIQENYECKRHLGISGKSVTYYKYFVCEFRIGKIVLRKFPIHITFQEGANMSLLGMSFLKMFDISIKQQQRSIELKALHITERLITEKFPAVGIEDLFIPQIGIVDALSQLDKAYRAEEARKVHKMILENDK